MSGGDVVALVAVVLSVTCIFVLLPWMILHYISKARSAGSLSEEEGRMLEDLWRSARTMERRIETLERLIDQDATQVRPHVAERSRGDIN